MHFLPLRGKDLNSRLVVPQVALWIQNLEDELDLEKKWHERCKVNKKNKYHFALLKNFGSKFSAFYIRAAFLVKKNLFILLPKEGDQLFVAANRRDKLSSFGKVYCAHKKCYTIGLDGQYLKVFEYSILQDNSAYVLKQGDLQVYFLNKRPLPIFTIEEALEAGFDERLFQSSVFNNMEPLIDSAHSPIVTETFSEINDLESGGVSPEETEFSPVFYAM